MSEVVFAAAEAGETSSPRPAPDMSVTVNAPFLVNHDGRSFYPGDTAVVPEALAQEWIKARWVNAAGQ